MGDRDGDDEPASEEPIESQSGDSDDEQPVPSSTAADAKANDDAAANGDPDESGGDDDAPNASNGGDDAPNAGDGEDTDAGDDADAGGWEPPTTDAADDFDDQSTPVEDDDPDEWWDDHPPESVVDEEPTEGGEPTADEPTDDDAPDIDDDDLDPAARRNQMRKSGDEQSRRGANEAHDSGTDSPQGVDRSQGDSDSDDRPGYQRANGPTGDQSRDYSRSKGPGTAQAATATPSGGGGHGQAGRSRSSYDPDVEPATAPDDEEMPLTEHVEEMALRLLAVALVMFGVAGIVVFYAGDLVNFLWYSFLGDPGVCPGPQCEEAPRVLHPLAVPLAYLKASTLVGFIIALPVGVYQTYRFMRPGLYPRERRYYLAAIPTSLVLAGIGVGFAYFAVLPSMFAYFTDYSEQAAEIAFSLTETFNLIILMLGFFALIFQIPLLVMLAIMMGVTTRQWLADRRLYFWGGFAAVAFLFSPDPTGMAPLIVAVTMIVLFEATLTLLRWTGTGSPIPTAAEAADARPKAYLAAAVGGYVASSGPLPPGYYDLLPTAVTDALATSGGPIATPAIIAGGLIGLFEIGAFLLRRYGHSRRALELRLKVDDARIPIWLAAVVVGYFGSPQPTILTAARDLALAPLQSVLVAIALIVLYEVFVAVLSYREGKQEALAAAPGEEP